MAGWSWWLSGKIFKAKAGKDNDMKRMMNQNNENKKMARAAETISHVFGNLFGKNTPVVAVMDCGGSADEEDSEFLRALEEFLSENEQETKPDADMQEQEAEPDGDNMKIPEGDGEEVFNEMLADLISFADMVERMELILTAVSTGKMCPVRGMRAADDMLGTVSEVLLKWAKYQEPVA